MADDLPFHQTAEFGGGFGVGESAAMSRMNRSHTDLDGNGEGLGRGGRSSGMDHDAQAKSTSQSIQAVDVGAAVIIDHDRSSAELLAHRLVTEGIVRSVQVCDSISRGLSWADQLQASVLITEMLVGDENALTVAEHLRESQSKLRLVILSRTLPTFLVNRLITAQVAGCFAKQDQLTDVLAGLRRVLKGERALSSGYSLISEDTDPSVLELNRFLSRLSSQQFQVLLGLAQGLPAKEVANQIQSTAKAIDSLKYRLMKRLQLRSRVELTRWAIRQGLIQP